MKKGFKKTPMRKPLRVIQQWAHDGTLGRIPKDITLGRQLGRMTKESLQDGQRPNFYAVNAFKNITGKFDEAPIDWSGFNQGGLVSAEGWT